LFSPGIGRTLFDQAAYIGSRETLHIFPFLAKKEIHYLMTGMRDRVVKLNVRSAESYQKTFRGPNNRIRAPQSTAAAIGKGSH
jgi:hypothetical protein